MTQAAVGQRASESLLHHEQDLARTITDRVFAARPELLAKYGERGRAHCLQDMRYNLQHLAGAVELGAPELFAGYVRWLEHLLRVRNVPAEDIRHTLEEMDAVLSARLAADEAAATADCIRAGLEALLTTGRT